MSKEIGEYYFGHLNLKPDIVTESKKTIPSVDVKPKSGDDSGILNYGDKIHLIPKKRKPVQKNTATKLSNVKEELKIVEEGEVAEEESEADKQLSADLYGDLN
jgi:hypothetical protein